MKNLNNIIVSLVFCVKSSKNSKYLKFKGHKQDYEI